MLMVPAIEHSFRLIAVKSRAACLAYIVDKDPRATTRSPNDGRKRAAVGFESAVSGPLVVLGASWAHKNTYAPFGK